MDGYTQDTDDRDFFQQRGGKGIRNGKDEDIGDINSDGWMKGDRKGLGEAIVHLQLQQQ